MQTSKLTNAIAQDKVTIKTFAATIEAGKLERALDLVNRLHLKQSYDIAMTLAANHRKMVELIEKAKKLKFASVNANASSDADDDDDEVVPTTSSDQGRQITPEMTEKRRREEAEQGRSVRVRFGQ